MSCFELTGCGHALLHIMMFSDESKNLGIILMGQILAGV